MADQNLPFDDILTGDLSQFSITEEDIAAASATEEFADTGEVSVPDSMPYLEFDSALLLRRLLPFKQKKASANDIVTRSLLIEVDGTSAIFRSSDGISFLSATLPVRANKFPKFALIETETFYQLTRWHSKLTYLMHHDNKFFTNFFDGEHFIQSFNLQHTMFYRDHGKILSQEKLNPAELLNDIRSLTPVVVSSDVPDLGFIFVEPQGIFASNGVIVSKVNHTNPRFVIRHSDINLLAYMLDSIKEEPTTLIEYENAYAIQASSFTYAFPKVKNSLTDAYKNTIGSSKDKYFINLPHISSILSVVSSVPDSSGIIELNFHNNGIDGVSRTRKGEPSHFKVSNSFEGATTQENLSISSKALSVIMRVLKGESSASVSISDGRLLFESGAKQIVLLLKK